MNKNQKIIGGVVLVIIIVTGVWCCYAFYEKGKKDGKKDAKKKKGSKNEEEIKKNSKRIDDIEKAVDRAFKDNPNADANSTIEHLAQERKDLFQNQTIRIVEAEPKVGSEDLLRALLKNEPHPSPEAVSDLIENPIETTLSNENVSNTDDTIPSQSSNSIFQSEEAASEGLASVEEMRNKLSSALGQKQLETDLWKFHSKNSKGEYILGYEETKELISNICYHYPDKSTGRVFETKHERAYTLTFLMHQIYDRHKLNNNEALKFAQILVDNIRYYQGKTAKSIVSNWSKIGKGKLRNELAPNPHIILI